jgi:hypothetical protein
VFHRLRKPLQTTAKPTLAVLLRLAWPCHPFFGARS